MHRAAILALTTALATGLCVAPIAAFAAPDAKAAATAYKAPRTSFGQPDLMGFWSNSSLTPLNRPAKLGAQAVYSEAEVKKMEAAVVEEVEEGNKPTDPNAPAEPPRWIPPRFDPSSPQPAATSAATTAAGSIRAVR